MNPSILLYILIHFNFQIIHCNFTNHLKCAVTNVKYPKKFFPDLHENVMKTLGDELRSANNYWLTVLSLDVVETNKIKHLLPSKKLTKITEQTKLYFHRRRITPIIMKPRNIPSLMECRTYESYELNSSTVSKINGNGPPHYKQYKINKILGKGVQGSVLEVANNGKEYALKVFNSASDFILQLNSLIAYNTMFNQLQIHHLSQGANQIFNLGYKFHGSRSDYNLIEYHQPFCLLMSKLHGKMYMYSEFRYRNFARMTPVKMKRALKVIILVFRQMQLLHFTYNEYSIFRNDKLFSSRTFTSFHGDIHSANIMMVNHKKFGADFPQFIDVGFAVSWLMDNPFKILVYNYNRLVLDEHVPFNLRSIHHKVVPKKMLLSFLQVMDFCMFWFIIIDSFISTIRWTGPPMGFCEELMETREPKSKRILKPQRLYLHFGKSFLWPLLSRMFQVHSDTQIYGDTWLKIYTILKV